jgi:hypothetical protein
MIAICEVLEETTESFVGKRGLVNVYLLVCLDRTPQGWLRNTFDYELTAEEKEKFTGKARGKTLELAIQDITLSFAKRVRCKGAIRRFGNEQILE